MEGQISIRMILIEWKQYNEFSLFHDKRKKKG